MAPRGRSSRARGLAGRARGGRASTRTTRTNEAAHVPDVYRDLLSEAAGSSTAAQEDDESRPQKRPKRAGHRPQRAATLEAREEEDKNTQKSSPVPDAPLQTIEDDSHGSDSDLEFEDIEIGGENEDDSVIPNPAAGPSEGFSVAPRRPEELKNTRARRKRKPVTSAEKSMRLDIHKMHVMYLTYHCFYRNHWCNDEFTQEILKQMVPTRTITLLNPDSRATQAQSSRLFLDGLSHICELWHSRFSITALGLKRPQWLVEKDELANFKLHERTEKPLELADFRRAAQNLQGSADLGAQLFCCLLRAVGVEARLVCSLQPLGFASAAELGASANNTPAKKTIYANNPEDNPQPSNESSSGPATENTTTPKRIARIGQPSRGAHVPPDLGRPPPSLSEKPKRIERPSYPVFWVEAFNSAHQRWVAVDSLATKTVGKPSRLEPGLSDARNCLSYAVAFEEDGVAVDVTRRYAKAYTAKTRKLRVETTENGARWIRKAMKIFHRPRVLDRDHTEDAELVAKEASEGMPGNIQDFRNHPQYALERHLRRNEVIHPKRDSGRVNVGSGMNPKFEAVYKRKDVHTVKSAAKWFRLGREIKFGEQPLKHAAPRRGRFRESSLEPEEVGLGAGLYATFQTSIYVPPPVVNGRLPKNMYGNIDVYVPSMIPEGAVWIRVAEARQAARMLKIDYADAVTGFDFKGRHGTARIDGVLVAEEHHEAVEATIESMKEVQHGDMEDARSREALRLWKRFIVGLRIVQRIDGYGRSDEQAVEEERIREEALKREIDEEMMEYDEEEHDTGGGGFVVENGEQSVEPSSRRSLRNKRRMSSSPEAMNQGGGGFLPDSDDDGGGGGGGFLAESDEEDAFIPEAESEPEEPEEVDKSNGQELAILSLDSQVQSSPAPLPTGSSFGFEDIQIPTSVSSVYAPNADQFESLPRVIRGIRQSVLPIPALEDGARVEEQIIIPSSPVLWQDPMDIDPEPTTVKAIERGHAEQVSGSLSLAEDTKEQATQPEVPSVPASAKTSDNDSREDAFQEGLPVSSYDYDDDMLLEDPDEEDDEPEWLL